MASKPFAQGAMAQDLLKVLSSNEETFLKYLKADIVKRIYRKLDGGYLGVRTGQLRRTTGAVIDYKNSRLIVGTRMPYGVAYETGRKAYFKATKKQEKYQVNVYKQANPAWRGKILRPFMRDSIRESEEAFRRVIRRLVKAKQMGAKA
jgi:integrase